LLLLWFLAAFASATRSQSIPFSTISIHFGIKTIAPGASSIAAPSVVASILPPRCRLPQEEAPLDLDLVLLAAVKQDQLFCSNDFQW
jgi:hypothetical protein